MTARTAARRLQRPITLEALVIWAYRDQRVDRMSEASLLGAERAADRGGGVTPLASSAALLARLGALGTRIDGGGQSWDCHPDAEKLHELVSGFAREDALAIMRFGRRAAAPDWQVPDSRPERVPVPENAPGAVRHKVDVWWYRIAGRRPRLARGESALVVRNAAGSYDLGCRYCPITYYPPPEIARRRGATMPPGMPRWRHCCSISAVRRCAIMR